MTVDCNARYVNNDPKIGTSIAVAEAARNISCAGGEPSAITNCLNFGNPYNPEVYWQFVNAIKGMGEACEKFQTPVTGGNVSFYNQTVNKGKDADPVFPTPTIGMIGVIRDKERMMTMDFKEKGDLIFLLGESKDDISSSEYLASIHGIKGSPAPYFDIDREYNVQKAVRALINQGVINAAHDVSDGGLYTCLVEMGLNRGLGFDITSDADVRLDSFLFGEAQSRIVITIDGNSEEALVDELRNHEVPFTLLGHVTRGKMVVDDEHFGFIADAKEIYNTAIERKMDSAVSELSID
jgi:phosphoribosylformylglycinamidine synthase